MASPDPLNPYRKVQSDTEKELTAVLESTARSIRRRIGLLKVGIGGDVRRAQLNATLGAIKRMQRSMWVGGVVPTVTGGVDDAEKAAESAIEVMTRVAYASLPDAAAEILVRGLRAAAESGLKSDKARKRRELSARVYRQASLNEGKVEQMIREGLIANLSAKELADTVYEHVSPSVKGGASYAAMRLARTEINNAFHERQLEGAKRPGVKAAKWNLSGSHKVPDECNVYAAHNGTGEWPVDLIPEKPHPQCFCYITYVTTPPEEFRKRLAAGSFDDEIERRTRENMARAGQKVGKLEPPQTKVLKSVPGPMDSSEFTSLESAGLLDVGSEFIYHGDSRKDFRIKGRRVRVTPPRSPGGAKARSLVDAETGEFVGQQASSSAKWWIEPAPPVKTKPFADRLEKAATKAAALLAAPFGAERQRGAKGFTDGMTPEMKKAISRYVGIRYEDINEYLRGNEESSERVTGWVRDIDSAMDLSKTDKDAVVYRGMGDASGVFGDRLDNDLTGMQWLEQAYVSTTALESRTKNFLGGPSSPSRLLMRILVPKGTPAIEASSTTQEAELLIGRGKSFRVVADNGVDDKGIRRIDVELIDEN